MKYALVSLFTTSILGESRNKDCIVPSYYTVITEKSTQDKFTKNKWFIVSAENGDYLKTVYNMATNKELLDVNMINIDNINDPLCHKLFVSKESEWFDSIEELIQSDYTLQLPMQDSTVDMIEDVCSLSNLSDKFLLQFANYNQFNKPNDKIVEQLVERDNIAIIWEYADTMHKRIDHRLEQIITQDGSYSFLYALKHSSKISEKAEHSIISHYGENSRMHKIYKTFK